MRALVVNADLGGCGFYRLIAPSLALQAQNDEIEIELDPNGEGILCGWTGDFPEGHVSSVQPLDFDVVVFQRPLSRHLAEAIPFIRANGTAVVVELDDDFWHIDPRNVAFESLATPLRNHGWLERACREADLVTVSTPALARVVPSSAIRVLPNYVPEEYLTKEENPEANWDEFRKHGLIVGWTGNPATHPGDLETTGGSIVKATRKEHGLFFGIGSLHSGRILGYEPGESMFCEPVELERYPEVVCGLDIGIVPLKINQFNEAKSWLKGLEYAALRVPFVAAPTGEYSRLNKLGAGLLADSCNDWYQKLRNLMVNDRMRGELTQQAFETAKIMTYTKNAYRWAEAWQQAIDNHARRGVHQ
jgi:hypothetical protein